MSTIICMKIWHKIFAMTLFLMLVPISNACTVWASVGNVNEHGGLLLAKNRDENADYVQDLVMVKPKEGYRYFALAYKLSAQDKNYQYFSSGVNEKGLVLVNTNAGIYNESHLNATAGTLQNNILQNYASVAAVIADQKKLFAHDAPINLMLGDKNQAAIVEVTDNKYQIKSISQGYIWHTNHYVLPGLTQYNQDTTQSSLVRYTRIGELLKAYHQKFTIAAFELFAQDKNAGDNNSILRIYTLATWIIEIPNQGTPKLYVKLFDPEQPTQTKTLLLDQKFWQDL